MGIFLFYLGSVNKQDFFYCIDSNIDHIGAAVHAVIYALGHEKLNGGAFYGFLMQI